MLYISQGAWHRPQSQLTPGTKPQVTLQMNSAFMDDIRYNSASVSGDRTVLVRTCLTARMVVGVKEKRCCSQNAGLAVQTSQHPSCTGPNRQPADEVY